MARRRIAGRVDVVVGAQTSQFQRGMKRARGSLRRFERQTTKAAKAMTGFGSVFGFSLGGGALLAGIRRTTQLADKMENMSEAIGIGSERLRALDTTLGIAGISLDNYTKAVTRSSQAVEYLLQGRGEYVDYFKEAGLEAKHFADANGDVEKQLFIILNRLKEIQKTDKSLALASAANLIGTRNTRLLALTDTFESDVNRHLAITGNVGEEASKKLQKTNEQIDLLQKGLSNAFDNAIAENADVIQESIEKLHDHLPGAAKSAANLAAEFAKLGGFILEHGDKFAILLGAIAGAKIGGLKGAIVGAGAVYLYQGVTDEGASARQQGNRSPRANLFNRGANSSVEFISDEAAFNSATLGRGPRRRLGPRRPAQVVASPAGVLGGIGNPSLYQQALGRQGVADKVAALVGGGIPVSELLDLDPVHAGSLARLRGQAHLNGLQGAGAGGINSRILQLQQNRARQIARARVTEAFDLARDADSRARGDSEFKLEQRLAVAQARYGAQSKQVKDLNKDLSDLRMTNLAISNEWERQRREILPGLIAEAQGHAADRVTLAEATARAEDKVIAALAEQEKRLGVLRDTAQETSDILVRGFEEFVLGTKSAKEAVRDLGREIAQLAFRRAVTEPASNALSSFLVGAGTTLFGSFLGGGGGSFSGARNIDGGRALRQPPLPTFQPAGASAVNQYFSFESGVGAAEVRAAIQENNEVFLDLSRQATQADLTRRGSGINARIGR